jgi:translation initiation factor 3 subunit C
LKILICFDSSPGQFAALNLDIWNKIHESIISILNLYSTIKEKDIGYSFLQNNLVSFLEKLEMELYKALQFTDYNSTEYLNRIRDEGRLISICLKVENFYREWNNITAVAKLNIICLKHVYYKNEFLFLKLRKENPDLSKYLSNPNELVNQYCSNIFNYLDDKLKIKALLYQISYYAIHDDFKKAKLLFNSTHLYELINNFRDEQLKTLFNRALVLIGLSAFRDAKYSDVIYFLSPLCSNGTTKLKEYIAQSYNKENEKNILFDKEDKKRTTPHIMNIQLDEIESVFYLSSMIVDLPSIIFTKLGCSRKNRKFGQFFNRIYSNFDKQVFNGPPENNKDRILSCSILLAKGNWKKSADEIKKIKIFKKYKNENKILSDLIYNCKIVALKCFILNYFRVYSSFNLTKLNKQFEIEIHEIEKIINDIVFDGEINGKWNEDIFIIDTEEGDNYKMTKKLTLINIKNNLK